MLLSGLVPGNTNTTSAISQSVGFTPVAIAAPVKMYEVKLTAYSSSPDETDDTPFTTASGGHVRDGVIAANFLPFGTKITIPEIFGNKVFVVEDRMNRRNVDGVDIWMPSKSKALRFGTTDAKIVILNDQPKFQIAEI